MKKRKLQGIDQPVIGVSKGWNRKKAKIKYHIPRRLDAGGVPVFGEMPKAKRHRGPKFV